MWLVTYLSLFAFFSFFFFFLFSARALVAFLDQSRWSICQNACFQPRMCLFGSLKYLTTFSGSNPQITSPKWAEIDILQPNQQSSKIAIYRSLMKIFVSNFMDKLITGTIIEKSKIRSKGVMKVVGWPTYVILGHSSIKFCLFNCMLLAFVAESQC